jgi:MFS family permease
MVVLFMGVLTTALDIALVATTLPAMRDAFGLDERSASWLLGTFVLFTLVGLPLMTALSDRYGRRIVYLVDFGLFITGGLVLISSSSFTQLMIGRAIQGLGAAGIFPVASAVIGDTVEPSKRGRSLGILGSVYGLAFMIGPILGGVLVQFGWRWPFIANLGLASDVLIVSALRIPEHRTGATGKVDWIGITVLAVLLGSLSFGMNQVDTGSLGQSLASNRVWPFLVLSLVLIPLFVRIERSAPRPVLRLGLIQKRQVALVCFFAAGAGTVEAAFVFMTDFTTLSLGVSHRAASFMLLPLVTAVSIASPLAGRLLDAVGSKRIISIGLMFMIAGMGTLALLTPSAAAFYAGSVGIGLGLACLLGSALSYILLAEAEVSERTVAQGLNTLFISVGQLMGSAIIGAIAASAVLPSAGYQSAFGWIAILSALLLAASMFLDDRGKEQAAYRTST